MNITYDDIKQANDTITTTPIEKKDKKTGEVKTNNYAEVNQRIKAFRMVYPDGFIITEMSSNENGVCVFKAIVGHYAENGDPLTLGVGTAYEKEGSSYINTTSYIENCETSAVGRALGMAGFGIDVSAASYEEVKTAILNQETEPERKASPKQIEILSRVYTGDNLKKLLTANGIETIEDLPLAKASELISKLKERS